jgi:hypothetical protein
MLKLDEHSPNRLPNAAGGEFESRSIASAQHFVRCIVVPPTTPMA